MLRRGLDRSELDRIGSVWQAPGFVATLVSVFCAFGGWALLMPVVPLEVIRAGGSDGAAGLATGAFMASTVLTQAVTPRVLRRVGYFPVMCGAGLFLGLPALVHLLSLDPVTVLVVAVVRGVGFGSVTVAESALLAELVPARLLGRSSGIFGAVIGVAELVGFPLGVQLGGAVWVVAAAVSVVGAVAALWVPLIRPAPRETAAEAADRGAVPTWHLVAVPAFGMCTIAMGFGALSTFTAPAVGRIDPVAATTVAGVTLSVIGAAQLGMRLVSGWWADRVGEPGHLAPYGQAAGVRGLGVVAGTLATGPHGAVLVACVLVAAVLFGGGFGVLQTDSLLMMFHRLPAAKVSEASAVWNMSFDSGTGIGAVVLGAVVSLAGYPGGFLAAAVLVATGGVALVLDRVLGRHRMRRARPTPDLPERHGSQ